MERLAARKQKKARVQDRKGGSGKKGGKTPIDPLVLLDGAEGAMALGEYDQALDMLAKVRYRVLCYVKEG
jgi:hypothetical protein